MFSIKEMLAAKRTWIKYFFSLFVIFLIPLLILGAFLYWNAVHKLREEVEAFNMERLNQSKMTLENQFGGLEQIAAKISFDPRLTPYMVVRNPYAKREAIEELKKYRVNQMFADDLFLYYDGSERIYMPSGETTLSAFVNHIYQVSSGEQFIAGIKEGQRGLLFADGTYLHQTAEAVTLSYNVPIPVNTQNQIGSVLFLVPGTMLSDAVRPLLGNFGSAVYILDQDRRPIAGHFSADFEPEQAEAWLSGHLAEGISSAVWNGRHYSSAVVRSNKLGWTFVTLIPTEQFFSRALEMQAIFYSLIATMVLAGLVVSFVVSHRYYRPIRELIRYTHHVGMKSKSSAHSNEFDKIRSFLDEAVSRHQRVQAELEEQRPFAREQAVMKLLNGGGPAHPEDQAALLKTHNLQLPGPYYFALYISLVNEHDPQERNPHYEAMMKQLAEIRLGQHWGYGAEGVHGHSAAVIMNVADHAPDTDTQERLMAELFERFHQLHGFRPTIGAGQMYPRLDMLHRSFLEASAAYNYKWKLGNKRAIFFNDIKSMEQNFAWYPLEHQMLFLQSLRQGDREAAGSVLSAIVEELKSADTSYHMLRCICFEVINDVLKMMNELKLSDATHVSKEFIAFQNLDDWERSLRKVIIFVCSHVDQVRESNNVKLRDAVLAYIHERFQTYDFSLEHVAGNFHITSSYLSRFIKDQTGHTFMEYVTFLKMDAIKQELVRTEKPLKAIIEENGYQNISSFIRKFKSVEGITPARYRLLYGGGNRNIREGEE